MVTCQVILKMNIFLIGLGCLIISFTEADVSHLLNHQQQFQNSVPENVPLSSYGVPQASILGNGVQSLRYSSPQLDLPSISSPGSGLHFNAAFPQTDSASGVSIQSYSSPSISTPAPILFNSPPNSYQYISSLSPSSSFVDNIGSPVDSFTSTSGGNIQDAFGVATNAASNLATSVENHQEPSDVTKNLYFFAAPEDDEEEEVQARIDLPAPANNNPKKSYKIIFIKAPTYRTKPVITVPIPQPNQEKTLVYVLVKKPETQPSIRYQESAAVAPPAKPEVFFIKYKNQKEAETAVANIQNKHASLEHDDENVNVEDSVSSTNSSLVSDQTNQGILNNEQSSDGDSLPSHNQTVPSGNLEENVDFSSEEPSSTFTPETSTFVETHQNNEVGDYSSDNQVYRAYGAPKF